MANLSTLDFTSLVRNTVTAIQASCTTLLNLTVGSVLRAIVEANAAIMLWLQGIVLVVATLTRAATSNGSDLDSFYADFDFPRLPAKDATGQVTFGRLSDTAQAVVPFGATVQTGDGTQAFTVNTDPTNAAYNLALGGYVMAPGTPTVTVGVTAVNAGSQGNVAAGSITSIAQAISGVDTVTNASAFTNGVDAELDAAYRARFPLYIASLSRGTAVAVESAIEDVQQGLEYTLTENKDYNGTTDYGYFYVVIDDGSGYPPSGLLASVGSAIDAYRPLTSRFAVFAPIVETANVAMTITSASGYTHGNVIAAVELALQTFINALPLGVGLPYTQLAAIAYGVPGVTNVSAITLNSGTSDLTATAQAVIKFGSGTIA